MEREGILSFVRFFIASIVYPLNVCELLLSTQMSFHFSAHSIVSREILGMITEGNLMSQLIRKKVAKNDPVSRALYKRFKQVIMSYDACLGSKGLSF